MIKKIQFSTVMIMLSLALAVTSCEKPEEATKQPELVAVTEGNVAVPWEGGNFKVQYEINNPTATGEVIPATEAEWISGFFTGTYGEVSFTVAENSEEASRTATITLEYEGQSLDFTVLQARVRMRWATVISRIDIDSLTTYSMHVSVTPSDESMTYLVLSSDMESMAGFEDDNVLFEDAMNYYRSMAEMYGTTLEEYLASFLITGVYDDTFSDLEADTEYCVFVFGVSADGSELLTPIARGLCPHQGCRKRGGIF